MSEDGQAKIEAIKAKAAAQKAKAEQRAADAKARKAAREAAKEQRQQAREERKQQLAMARAHRSGGPQTFQQNKVDPVAAANRNMLGKVLKAIMSDDVDVINEIFQGNPDSIAINEHITAGRTLLTFALSKKSSKCVEALILHKADVNLRESKRSQMTPLQVSLMTQNEDCLRVLLENKASVDDVNNDGKTAVDYAKQMKFGREVHSLLEQYNILQENERLIEAADGDATQSTVDQTADAVTPQTGEAAPAGDDHTAEPEEEVEEKVPENSYGYYAPADTEDTDTEEAEDLTVGRLYDGESESNDTLNAYEGYDPIESSDDENNAADTPSQPPVVEAEVKAEPVPEPKASETPTEDNSDDNTVPAVVLSKARWQRDSDVPKCSCGQKFSLFQRRHHCRLCGKVKCGQCTTQKMNLFVPPEERRHYEKRVHSFERICQDCYALKPKQVHPPPSESETVSEHKSDPASTPVTKFGRPSESVNHIRPDLPEIVEWNEAYQAAVERRWQLDERADATTEEQLDVAIHMRNLIVHFSKASIIVATTLVQERYKPPEEQTIQALDVGGIAGGQKYRVHNIFFKFVADFDNIYGGDYFAQKAAGHELRGLRAYQNANVPGLNTGLMNIIDYAGFRIIAISCLPLGPDSLIYGSKDAGTHVFTSDEQFNNLMQKAAQEINIKGHLVGKTEKKELYSCVDIEGHKGTDGRQYVLDTARVFPPEKPNQFLSAVLIPVSGLGLRCMHLKVKNWKEEVYSRFGKDVKVVHIPQKGLVAFYSEHDMETHRQLNLKTYVNQGPQQDVNERATRLAKDIKDAPVIHGDCILMAPLEKARHLVNLLRPEWVKASPVPLSSDAFTWFGIHNHKEHNAEVKEATTKLKHDAIPQLLELLNTNQLLPTSGEQLCATLHERGIPVRYLGLLFSLTKRSNPAVRSLILTEMISRVCKLQLRLLMRTTARSMDHCMTQVIAFFNKLFGSSAEAEDFWKMEIKALLMLKFGVYGPPWSTVSEEAHPDTDLRPFIRKEAVFKSLLKQSGLVMTDSTVLGFTGNPDNFNHNTHNEPFSTKDLIGIRATEALVNSTDRDALQRILRAHGLSVAAITAESLQRFLDTGFLDHITPEDYQKWTELAPVVDRVYGPQSCIKAGLHMKIGRCAKALGHHQESLNHMILACTLLESPTLKQLVPPNISIGVHVLCGDAYLSMDRYENALDHFHLAFVYLEREYGSGMVTVVTSEKDIFITGGQGYVPPVARNRKLFSASELASFKNQVVEAADNKVKMAFAEEQKTNSKESRAALREAKAELRAAQKLVRKIESQHATDQRHCKIKTRENIQSSHPLGVVLCDRVIHCLVRMGNTKLLDQAHTKFRAYHVLRPFPSEPAVIKYIFGTGELPAAFQVSARRQARVPLVDGALTEDQVYHQLSIIEAAWTRKSAPTDLTSRRKANSNPEEAKNAWVRQYINFAEAGNILLSSPFDSDNTIFGTQLLPEDDLNKNIRQLMSGARKEWSEYYAIAQNVNKTLPQATTSYLRGQLAAKYNVR